MSESSLREMKDFEIRRIFLQEEANQIKILQANAPEFHLHYPKHNQWLDMAVDEIVNGTRVALGVYKLTFDSRRRPAVELIGSIILKKKLFADIIEMKNLFVASNYRGVGYGGALYDEVEEYSAKSGYSVIETEVPCSEINTVGFLHKKGFRVTEMKESPYRDGEYLYQMEKNLFPFYGGDHYDLYEIALWLINNYFAFSNVKVPEDGKLVKFDLQTKASLAGVYETRELGIKGSALIVDGTNEADIQKMIDLNLKSDSNFLLVFGKNLDQVRARFADRRIVLIDKQVIHRSFGHLFAYGPPNFPKSEIAGMVVAMNPEYFTRIRKTQTSFVYFKGGPVGKYLREGDKLLILCESTPRYPDGGIRGIGDVVETLSGSPEDVWSRFKDQSSFFGQDEYYTFTRNKRNVFGVLLRNFQRIPTIGYYQLKEVIGSGFNLTDIGHYYINHRMLARFVNTSKVLAQTASRVESAAKKRKRKMSIIRILFLGANPSDTTRLGLDEEIRNIDQALRQAEFRNVFEIKQHWAVRPTDIQSYLLRHKPDIVHFSGHGSVSSEIILEDNDGNSHSVSPRALSQLFSVLKDNIRCVVLNACYSEQQAQAIAEHIDCVIGMSRALGDSAAISFATAFYQALGYGRDLNTAFDLGCVQINLENLDEQDTPKLLAVKGSPKEIVFVDNE